MNLRGLRTQPDLPLPTVVRRKVDKHLNIILYFGLMIKKWKTRDVNKRYFSFIASTKHSFGCPIICTVTIYNGIFVHRHFNNI